MLYTWGELASVLGAILFCALPFTSSAEIPFELWLNPEILEGVAGQIGAEVTTYSSAAAARRGPKFDLTRYEVVGYLQGGTVDPDPDMHKDPDLPKCLRERLRPIEEEIQERVQASDGAVGFSVQALNLDGHQKLPRCWLKVPNDLWSYKLSGVARLRLRGDWCVGAMAQLGGDLRYNFWSDLWKDQLLFDWGLNETQFYGALTPFSRMPIGKDAGLMLYLKMSTKQWKPIVPGLSLHVALGNDA